MKNNQNRAANGKSSSFSQIKFISIKLIHKNFKIGENLMLEQYINEIIRQM
jgi:hypothetical protein